MDLSPLPDIFLASGLLAAKILRGQTRAVASVDFFFFVFSVQDKANSVSRAVLWPRVGTIYHNCRDVILQNLLTSTHLSNYVECIVYAAKETNARQTLSWMALN